MMWTLVLHCLQCWHEDNIKRGSNKTSRRPPYKVAAGLAITTRSGGAEDPKSVAKALFRWVTVLAALSEGGWQAARRWFNFISNCMVTRVAIIHSAVIRTRNWVSLQRKWFWAERHFKNGAHKSSPAFALRRKRALKPTFNYIYWETLSPFFFVWASS